MMECMVVARRFIVSGRVQGVGFRNFASKAGNALGLNGWVRNLHDGRVECLACGTPARLQDFELRLRQGPLLSQVRSVEVTDAEPDASIEGFYIR